MSILLLLIPLALLLGGLGLAAFIWSMKTGQYDDLDGAAVRILLDDDGPASGLGGSGDAADEKAVHAAEGGLMERENP